MADLPLFQKDLGIFDLDRPVRGLDAVGHLARYAAILEAAELIEVTGGGRFRCARRSRRGTAGTVTRPRQLDPRSSLTADTRGLLGEAQLRAMKPTAFLVNVARAEIVDEDALYRALAQRAIAGAALDVWVSLSERARPRVSCARPVSRAGERAHDAAHLGVDGRDARRARSRHRRERPSRGQERGSGEPGSASRAQAARALAER